ncbi:SdiA-regulated domain-containing protein [Pseudomonas mangiferae]|uniref:DNA-binding protein n=1 Tax=Pseudomonas mangiferae TaxID=2593654 RepID=A0A553GTG1_9PSED|nr:SdiA-regulated domain-containing protein [Pseudomonas mangiferae]TRX72812.1 DNA-binding protein [Pseudomonas mangiferae]
MRRSRSLKTLLVCLSLACLLLAAVAAQWFRLYERGWFLVQEWRHAPEWRERGVWLPDYRVVLEARPLEGLSDLSALTYDPQRRTLFSVTNKRPALLELSLDGRLLRRIELVGFADPEAVEYIGPGRFVISDERRQRLTLVQVDAHSQRLDAAAGQQLTLGLGRNGNKGFEGLAYDAAGQRLFVAKERDPVRIYEVRGFPAPASGPLAVQVADDPKRDARLFVRDLSSLLYDARSGHLLALSDESRLILELDAHGRPLSSLSLLPGLHGLRRGVPQAEGMAMDEQGTLYLVSEPNLFYVFRKAR